MDREHIRVGVAQIDTRQGSRAQNLQKHLSFIAEARGRGLDLLVFPETSLTGYPHNIAHDEGLRRDAPEIQRIAEAAGKMTVTFGFVEEALAAQFYNTCIALTAEHVLHIHRKLNLATYGNLEEGKYFANGRYVDAFDLVEDFWRASVLICADVWNPALVHIAALHGATMLLVPTNSARETVSREFSNPDGWDLVSRFYAMIYGMPILMANRVGTEAGVTFWGGSRIIDPYGNILVQADEEGEMLISAELTYDAIRRARIQLPTVRDSNLALVQREITRLSQFIGVPTGVRG